MKFRQSVISASLAAAGFMAALPAQAQQAPTCTHTVGMVVSLTGAAGRFGQAAAKSVELAFNGLNEAAGSQGIAGCKLGFDLRDAQSQGQWLLSTRRASWWT